MTIKEVEKALGIPRANIRFYEKEGFINPERKENEYRDYSENDVEILRKVVIFRKLGLSLDQIRDLMDGSTNLANAMEENTQAIKDKLEELNGVLEICSEISRDKNSDFLTFDTSKYWSEIFDKEQDGKKFFDISKDFVDYQKDFLLQYLGNVDGERGFRATNVVDGEFLGGSPTIAILMAILDLLLPVFFLWRCGTTGILIGICIGLAALVLLGLMMWVTHKYILKYPGKQKTAIIIRRASLVFLGILEISMTMLALEKLADRVDISAIGSTPDYIANAVYIIASIILIILGVKYLTNKARPRFAHLAFDGLLLFLLILFHPLGLAFIQVKLEQGLVGGILFIIACASYLFCSASNAIMLFKDAK